MNFFKNITPLKIILTISIGQFILIFVAIPFSAGYSLYFLFFTPIGFLFSLIVAFLYKTLYSQSTEVTTDNLGLAISLVPVKNYTLSALLYLPSLISFANELISTSVLNITPKRFFPMGGRELDSYSLPAVFLLLYLLVSLIYFMVCKSKGIAFSSGLNLFNIKLLDLLLFIFVLIVVGLGLSESGGRLFH